MKTRVLFLLASFAAFSCCNGNGTEEVQKADAPVLVSVSPADGAVDVALNTSEIVLTYDQNIKVLTTDQSKITLDGGASVTKVIAYSKNVTVSISGLAYSTKYTLDIPEGIVNGYKDNQETSAAVSVSFTTVAEPEDPGTDERLSDVAWNLAKQLSPGINLGNQMDGFYNGTWAGDKFLYPDELAWNDVKLEQATFTGIKNAGFKSVRIPITWLKMIGDSPSYTINSEWLNRVAEVVGFAHTAGLNVIINTHHDENHHSIIENGVDIDTRWLDVLAASNSAEKNAEIKTEIAAFWTQVANKFADCGDWLIFEAFNEINDGGWGWSAAFKADPSKQCGILNEWNQTFVTAVRATGNNNAIRWLGVPTYAANPTYVDYLTVPEDPAGKTMISVHFYDPSAYTIGDEQYSDWGHTGAAGKKAEGSDEDYVNGVFHKLCRNYVNKGIPVYVGEFGASMRAKSDTRAWSFYKYYMEYVVKSATTEGLPVFLWDNGAKNSGKEQHGYINHGTGAYIGNSKEIVDLIVKAATNSDESYTLESVYNSAPKF